MPAQQRKSSPRGHSARVVPHDKYTGPRVFRFKCSCGAMSWDFDTKEECRTEADKHVAAQTAYDAREITTDG